MKSIFAEHVTFYIAHYTVYVALSLVRKLQPEGKLNVLFWAIRKIKLLLIEVALAIKGTDDDERERMKKNESHDDEVNKWSMSKTI